MNAATALEVSSPDRCPECRSVAFVQGSTERYCPNCGLVAETIITSDALKADFRSSFSGRGIGTASSGLGRLAVRPGLSRNLYFRSRQVEAKALRVRMGGANRIRLEDLLRLFEPPRPVVQRARDLVRVASQRRLLRGVSCDVTVVAVLALSYRLEGLVEPGVKELCRILPSVAPAHVWRVYRRLKAQMAIPLVPLTAAAVLRAVAARLELPKETLTGAERILKQLPSRPAGRDHHPTILAGAAVYVASRAGGMLRSLTLVDVAKGFGVTEVSIREARRDIETALAAT